MTKLLAVWLFHIVFLQADHTQISGYVTDPTGAVIQNASITATNERTGLTRIAVSNAQGYYVISHLPSGTYTVTAEMPGFRRFQETGKRIESHLPARVNIALELGEISETVSVVASPASLRSETATLGGVIDSHSIESIPLNGRNPLFLALFVPGVNSRDPLGSGLSFGLSSGSINIHGSRLEESLITFDGAVGTRTRSNGNSIGTASLETVDEVQVLTSNYSAEYGRTSGGQIRMVSRSGSRDFHGSIFEFLRNSALDANGFERNRLNRSGDRPCSRFFGDPHCRPQPARFNQFGYVVNGPVLLPFSEFNRNPNKIFWLFGQEWVRLRRTVQTIIAVPSMAMRRGDFSELLDPANRFYARTRTIRDPITGEPFPGNIIPPGRLSPNGIAFLSAYPEPTLNIALPGANNFFQERPEITDQRKDTLSVDYYLANSHQIRWRTQLYHYFNVGAFRSGTDRAVTVSKRPNQTASLNWVWTASSSLVNEFTATGSRDEVHADVDTRSNAYRRSIYGINYPYVFQGRKEIADKIPTINFGSLFAELDGGSAPNSSTGPVYVVANTITKLWGSHTIKSGLLFERSGQNDFDQINAAGVPGGTNNQNGRFEFRDTRAGAPSAGLDIANAALGLFASYSEIGVRSFTPYRGHMFEWFVQDSWKVSPKLRLEMGLRHSIIQPHYSLWRNMSLFDPEFYDPAIAVTQDAATGYITAGDNRSRYNGIVIPGESWPDSAHGRIPLADSGELNFLFRGVPKEYSAVQKRDFQPRVGIAVNLDDKTVVRGGAGRFIVRLGVSDSVFLGGNPPLQPMVSIANGSVDNPSGGTNRDFPLSVTARDRDFKNPESWMWNITVQRELRFDTLVEAGYVGRRGLHLQRERNLNQLLPGTLQSNAGVNEHALRPFRGFGPIRITSNEGTSLYNALQLGAYRRFGNGLSFNVAYTYSKSFDDGSDQRFLIPNANDARHLWGPSNFDRNHVLLANVVYDLPILRSSPSLVRTAFGGWTISSITQFQSGTPFSVATYDDFAGVGTGSGAQYWVVNGNPQLPRSDRKFAESNSDSNFWFATRNPDGTPIFMRPADGTFNTQRVRNIIYGPGFQNHSLALTRTFKFAESQRIQFRVEAFNWVNHPNWRTPSRDFVNPNSSSFGKVNSKEGERQIQIALRYAF